MIPRRLLVAGCLLLASCQFGSRPAKYPPARTGAGAAVRVVGQRRDIYEAELLVVADSQLLVLRNQRLAVARLAQVQQVIIHRLGPEYTWYRGMKDEPLWRTRARLLSRYPQGLTPEQLARLLAPEQAVPDTLR